MCTVCCTRRSNVLRLDKLVRNVSDSLRDEDMPRVERREAQAHELAAIAKLFPESEQSRHWSLITLVIAGGMRRGELAALRWSAVDLATPDHDPRELAEVPGLPWLKDTKRYEVQRIELPELAMQAQRRQRKLQAAEKLRSGGLYQDSGYVFTPKRRTLQPHSSTRRSHDAPKAPGSR
jgi:integrase